MNDLESVLIPLFALVFAVGLPISIPIVMIVLNYRKRRQLMQLHHAERMASIERGMEIPPLPLELINDRDRSRSPRTSLLPGLVWFFIGLAILISMGALDRDEGLLGTVPMGIGLAYLIYYLVEGRRLEREQIESDLKQQRAEQRE